MKIDITSNDQTYLIVALDTSISDNLKLRKYPNARTRLRQYIAVRRKLELACHNSVSATPLKTFAELRSKRLEWKKRSDARKAAALAAEQISALTKPGTLIPVPGQWRTKPAIEASERAIAHNLAA